MSNTNNENLVEYTDKHWGRLMEAPHLRGTGFFSMVDHPAEGKVRSMAVPTKCSECKPEIKRQTPRLGQHSSEIFLGIGLFREQIARLVADGVTLGTGPDSDRYKSG
jgi:crotonobetainyl-CoA:carnitine CoA-transferase CaiB-like acyl-CoA transferase